MRVQEYIRSLLLYSWLELEGIRHSNEKIDGKWHPFNPIGGLHHVRRDSAEGFVSLTISVLQFSEKRGVRFKENSPMWI
jgi:hypothetical protein